MLLVAAVCAGNMTSSATVESIAIQKRRCEAASPGGRARAQLAPETELLTLLALLDRLCAMLTWLAHMGGPVEAGQRERSRWRERPGASARPNPKKCELSLSRFRRKGLIYPMIRISFAALSLFATIVWSGYISFVVRPDGNYQIIQRHGIIAVSTAGLLGPYKVQQPTTTYAAGQTPPSNLATVYPNRPKHLSSLAPQTPESVYVYAEDPIGARLDLANPSCW